MSTIPTIAPQKTGSLAFGAIFSCILFALPLGLVYNFVYYKRSGILSSIILFFIVFLLGYTVTLMFYRVAIMNDASAKINKIGSATALSILGTTFAAFMIVAVTLFSLAAVPSLVTIFENTFGYWFIGLWGLTGLAGEIFTSPTMNGLKDNADPNYFNYNFLITQINTQNLNEFITYGQSCGKDAGGKPIVRPKLPLDFDLKFTDQGQIDKLSNLVHLKKSFGHFMWVYLTSIIAIFISMISATLTSNA